MIIKFIKQVIKECKKIAAQNKISRDKEIIYSGMRRYYENIPRPIPEPPKGMRIGSGGFLQKEWPSPPGGWEN